MNNEPAVTVGTITAVVSALLTLLAAFGLNLSADQTAAVVGVVAVLAPLVAAFITRRKVTPVTATEKG
jgi:ABC-type multidrug transport system fused ATPase/permease subunit